jgi:hypothetical protein
MPDQKRRSIQAILIIGFSFVIIALAYSRLAGNPLAKTILVGLGVLILACAIIVQQLRFYREGDEKKSREARNRVDSNAAAASLEAHTPRSTSIPEELKNPHQRLIWKNMEETRELMRNKEVEADAAEREREKIRLGLPEEEEIIIIADRSWLSLWPVVLVSLIFLAASVVTPRIPSIIFLVIGLCGLLYTAMTNRLTRYYLTNFRVLVSRRSVFARKPQWTAIHYSDIRRCSKNREFFKSSVRLVGKQDNINIKGLGQAQLANVLEHIKNSIPGDTCL